MLTPSLGHLRSLTTAHSTTTRLNLSTGVCDKKLTSDGTDGENGNGNAALVHLGIGFKLVERIERWFCEKRVEYAYIATEKDNEACIKIFAEKCNANKFRTPAILGHPVHAMPSAFVLVCLWYLPGGQKWPTNGGRVPNSWAVLSVCNNNEIFKLQVKGISFLKGNGSAEIDEGFVRVCPQFGQR
eukprot:Gb_32566 [translate_table: standard]